MLQVSKAGRRIGGKLTLADEARHLAGASHLDSRMVYSMMHAILFHHAYIYGCNLQRVQQHLRSRPVNT